ncbi:MAG: Gfo/Idh/MocA family oxidoreductase [Candidatus Omnitrophota bacterium]
MYRAAVIGCGRIGFVFDEDPKRRYPATHVAAYSRVDRVELAAVCDLNRELVDKCATKWGIPAGYTDLGEMLSKEKPDIVSICTPPETHSNILKTVVKHKGIKGIFCEKPLAATVEEAKEMDRACRERGIILQVGHQRRFDPLHLNIRESIMGGKFGNLQQGNFYYTAGIRNTGSHMFDILRFFFGEVEWVEAFFSRNISRKEKDPNLDGVLRFKNGFFATFQACDVNDYLIFEFNGLFEKARLVLKDSGFSVDFYEAGESENYSGYRELKKTASPFQENYQRNFMVNAVEHLLECIKKSDQSISSGYDGAKDVELIENSILSAEDGGRKIFLS